MSRLSKAVITYLIAHKEGATETAIAQALQARAPNVKFALRDTFGVYIDRWDWSPVKNDYVAVYKVVEVPPNEEKPTGISVELADGRRVLNRYSHAAYLADRNIDRSFLAGDKSSY